MYDAASLHRYGTPLPTLEEDEVPSKKPIRPEDQIVTDENGKRRFHGAFTGGFSAGYWNTVGSQEGWTPASFKSSRTEKAPARAQLRPEDFMDAEDLGEFGIAPQRMQARAEFTDDTNRKRRHEPPSTGVIPGRPVLEQLIQPRSENIGERILMSMGWRPGQGVGPRLTREKKKQVRQRRQHEDYLRRHYGDQSAQSALTDESSGSNSDNEGSDDGVTYAPDDYLPYVCQPKNDCFGLGYKEFLSRDPVLSQRHAKTSGGMATTSAAASGHINLFAPPPLQLVGKNNKTLSITGQAFGVGALEEDDEDIYARDDMTRYDFSLDDGKKRKEKKEEFVQDRAVLTGFQAAKNPTQCVPRYVVQLPDGFKPRNWLQRKCRFEPLDPERVKELERSFKHLEAKGELGPQQRGDLLDDESERPSTSAHARSQVASAHRLDGIKRLTDTTQQLFTRLAQIDRFTSGGVESSDKEEDLACQVAREQQELLQKARMKTKLLASDLTSMDFKPFITDEAKQKRYDEFLAANVTNETDIRAFLNKIQPIHLSSYDREMEKKEFVQAKNLYKPLEGSMAERFVSGAQCQEEQKAADQPNPDKSFKPKRTRSMWIPASLLCRRFNIAEPHGGAMAEEKQQPRTKLSIFNYLEGSVNKKSDFQTPVIIPKSMASTAKPRPIVRHERMDQTESGSTVVSRSTCKNVDVSISTNKRVQHKIMDETESCGAGVSQSSDKSRHDKVDKDKKSQESLNIWLVPPSEMGLSKSESDLQQVKEATTTATPASMLGRYKPKTALEKLVEEARDKPAWDKVDIYHAIFDDSSDDEAGRSGDNEPVKVTVITKRTSSSQTPEGDLPGTKKPTSANILRNDSPPRGIFKVLFPKDEKEAGTSKGISCSDSDTKRAQQERLKDLKSRLVDQLDHAKEASQPEARNDAAATPSKGGPVRIVFQPKSERLSGAGTTTPDSDDPTITAPVYGPKMPDFFKAPSTSASKDTFTVVSETTVDKKLRRLLEVHKAARGLPTIKEEEWVEKTLTEHDRSSSVDSDSSTDSDSDSDSDAASRKQKKRSKKKKYKKKNSKESEIKLRKKGKKVKKKSKKSKKSHKSKKSKTPYKQ